MRVIVFLIACKTEKQFKTPQRNKKRIESRDDVDVDIGKVSTSVVSVRKKLAPPPEIPLPTDPVAAPWSTAAAGALPLDAESASP